KGWADSASISDLEELAGRVEATTDGESGDGPASKNSEEARIRAYVQEQVFFAFCQNVWFDRDERALQLFGRKYEEAAELRAVVTDKGDEIQAVLTEREEELAREAEVLRITTKRYEAAIKSASSLTATFEPEHDDETKTFRLSGAGRWISGLSEKD